MAISPESITKIVTRFARDLCTRTEEEVAGLWTGKNLQALENARPGMFDSHIKNHNPIYYILQRIWFDNDPARLDPTFHRDKICKGLLEYYLDGTQDFSGIITQAQRESYKTTITHGALAHYISFNYKYVKGMDSRIFLAHHKEDIACDNLVALKMKSLSSAFLRSVWGEEPYNFSADIEFGTTKKFNWPCKEARLKESSVVAGSLGTKKTGDHYDAVIISDPVTEEHRESKKIRDTAKGRFIATRTLADQVTGKVFVDGTPYHIRDLYTFFEKSPRYKKVIIPAGGAHVNMPLSLPNRHSQEVLDARLAEAKELHDEGFYWLQYQLERRASSLIATDEAWLKYCDRDDFWDVSKNSPAWGIVVIVDPAWKGSHNAGEGDYAALAVVGLVVDGIRQKRYLLDMVHSNEMTAMDGATAIFALMRKWQTQDVAVEEHGSRTFRSMLEDDASKRGQFINMIDLKTKQQHKKDRIVTLLKHIQAGDFYLCREAYLDPLVSEYLDYPQTDHDDALDACAYSCDPNVVEMFSVPFAVPGGPAFHGTYSASDEPLTRYCTN